MTPVTLHPEDTTTGRVITDKTIALAILDALGAAGLASIPEPETP